VVFFVPTPSSSELGWVWSRKSPTTSWLGLPWRRGRDCPKRAFPLRERLQGKPYDRFALGVFFALFPRPSKLGSVRERKSPATSWLGLPWRREASRKALRSLRPFSKRGSEKARPLRGFPWQREGLKRAFPLREEASWKVSPAIASHSGLFRSLPSPKQAWLGQGAKKPGHFVAGLPWRRGRDSNPRYPCGHICFRDRPDRPLWHLSDTGRQI
jgi:hypothetical protein